METIDIFEFARNRARLEGSFKVAELGELGSFLANDEGEVRFEAEGLGEIRGRPAARLSIESDLFMPCARCNGPVPVEADNEAVFLFVKSEAEADAIPVDEDGEDEEVAVGSKRFSVAEWVAEEAILSLPSRAEHEDCAQEALWRDEEGEASVAEKPNPFAALAGLKTGR